MSPSSRAAAPALRMTRSLLFVPGDRPERFDKALASGAHAVVLDLEDAVAPAAKVGARGAVAAWLAGGKRAVVRINGADTPWFADDVAAVTAAGAAALMLPKAEPASLAAAAAASKLPLIALVETVAGVLGLRELARAPGVVRLAFGSIDFSAESGIADEADALTAVRNQIVLESCHAGLQPPIDGVSVELDSAELMQRHALRSRQLGFGGKLCIHPRQVAPVNAAFQPSQQELDWAQRVLAAFASSGGAVTVVDGKMVDLPVMQRARRIAADASP